MQATLQHISSVFESMDQLRVRFDVPNKVLWVLMDPHDKNCFNEEMLEEGKKCYSFMEQKCRTEMSEKGVCPIAYTILGSNHPTVFNYGGDIVLFKKLVKDGDRAGLRKYAQACIDIGYLLSVNFNLPMTTIALVQGDALGGGFESALCCSVMIAEKRARFGLPEILFNLFPGMGAYQFLARRVGMKRVEEILSNGRVYTAAEMHEMGVVDVLAENGDGEKAVYDFIKNHSKRMKARQGIDRVRQDVFCITKDSLERTADVWVETALALDDSDLRIMDRLARAQITRESNVGRLRTDVGGGF
jgi:DSF synthase